jgi:alkanesulfonate monooxygenase SsuD/methylene tetrahydromethanopterin reductase-like flavin-dependent oxidoreductase (luciferase family)
MRVMLIRGITDREVGVSSAATPAVGCLLPRFAGLTAGERAIALRLMEDVGLDHVGFGDHVSFLGGHGSDGLLAAASVLAASQRLAVNTAVYLLPLRHPVVVSRQLADLAQLAPGRFTFGVGVGGEDRHEFASCGVDPATRGRRMDEGIAVVRALLRGEEVDHDGEFFTLRTAKIVPTPVEPIPLIVGGRSDAALHRAGRLGDGWFGLWVSADGYRRSVATMTEAAADASRADPPSQNALNVWCGSGASADEARSYLAPAMEAFYGIPYQRFERWSPAGRPKDVAQFVAPYLEAGCSLINLIMTGPSLEHEIEACAEVRAALLTGAT